MAYNYSALNNHYEVMRYLKYLDLLNQHKLFKILTNAENACRNMMWQLNFSKDEIKKEIISLRSKVRSSG